MCSEAEKELWRDDIRVSFQEGVQGEKSRITSLLRSFQSYDNLTFLPSTELPSAGNWPRRPLEWDERKLFEKLAKMIGG